MCQSVHFQENTVEVLNLVPQEHVQWIDEQMVEVPTNSTNCGGDWRIYRGLPQASEEVLRNVHRQGLEAAGITM